MPGSQDNKPTEYYARQMEEGFLFMEKIRKYPVKECGEILESLPEAVAAADVEVEFSRTKIARDMERMFLLRKGLMADFLAVAREMNERGWVLKIEDGFRSRQMQKWLGRKPAVFDAVLQWTIRELKGEIPSPIFLFRRITSMVATRPKIGTHMSGSAIDISVLRRDDRMEVDRDGYYPEMCERTPMNSPFVSAKGHRNRVEITQLMARHGFVTYPWEFWHYNKGDAYAEYFLNTGQPARYGAIDWNESTRSITPIADPDEPLNSDEEIQFEIEQALKRMDERKR